MASFDMTAAEAILKEWYTDKKVEDLTYPQSPFFAMLDKDPTIEGEIWKRPVSIGNPQNASRDPSIAFSAFSTSVARAFEVRTVNYYSAAYLSRDTMLASKSNRGAFTKAATFEVDNAVKTAARRASIQLFRSGYGEVGEIAANGVSGATFTLALPSDVANFEIGQRLVFAASLASDALRDTDPLTVIAVNRAAGVSTVTCNANLSTVSAVAGDFVFTYGDRENDATPDRLVLSGLAAWLPVTSPTSTLFFNVDRSVDPTRLGGQRIDASTGGISVEEALIEGASLVNRESGKLDYAFMNHATWSQLQRSLSSQAIYEPATVEVGKFGFKSMVLNGAGGPVNLIADSACPQNIVYGLDSSTWTLGSMGKVPQLIDDDGLLLRVPQSDSYEARAGFYANLACIAPGKNVVIKVA